MNTWINSLKEIGKILADGVKNDPILAAIVLIVLLGIGAVIIIVGRNTILRFVGLVVVIGLAASGLFAVELSRQKGKLSLPSVPVNSNSNPVPIVDRLTDIQKDDIRTVLRKASQDVANSLGISLDLIRANLFSPDEHDQMRMIKQLTYNMNRPEETDISIPVGYGSTGRSFLSGQPNIAVFKDGWGSNTLAELDAKKIDPDLQWIISVPVKGRDEQARPIWIMNVDCLKERRDEAELRSALSRLYSWSYAISLIISDAKQTVFRQASDPSLKPVEAFRVIVTSAAGVTHQKEEVNSLVKEIRTSDVGAPNKDFIKSTSEITSLPALNSFTKGEFNKQVQVHFVSEKPK